jgi:hypothetical protein
VPFLFRAARRFRWCGDSFPAASCRRTTPQGGADRQGQRGGVNVGVRYVLSPLCIHVNSSRCP